MNTKVFDIDLTDPLQEVVAAAGEELRKSGVIVAPTETRYGLLSRVDDPEAVRRVFELKGRDPKCATAVFVSGFDELRQLAELNETAAAITRAFLPGPLTLVLPAKVPWSPPLVVNGKIGVRWSASPVIAALLKSVQAPITATSANRSGDKELSSIREIQARFGDAVSLYLDAGELSGMPSTVVDCAGPQPVILRQGPITETMLRQVAGQVAVV